MSPPPRSGRVALAAALAVAAFACRDPAHAPNATPIADAAVHTICTSEYGGDAATLQVWRESDGTFVTIELPPDASKRGADVPTVFFDDDGRETMRINQPSTPASPEALEAERRRDLATREGVRAEKIPCKGK